MSAIARQDSLAAARQSLLRAPALDSSSVIRSLRRLGFAGWACPTVRLSSCTGAKQSLVPRHVKRKRSRALTGGAAAKSHARSRSHPSWPPHSSYRQGHRLGRRSARLLCRSATPSPALTARWRVERGQGLESVPMGCTRGDWVTSESRSQAGRCPWQLLPSQAHLRQPQLTLASKLLLGPPGPSIAGICAKRANKAPTSTHTYMFSACPEIAIDGHGWQLGVCSGGRVGSAYLMRFLWHWIHVLGTGPSTPSVAARVAPIRNVVLLSR